MQKRKNNRKKGQRHGKRMPLYLYVRTRNIQIARM